MAPVNVIPAAGVIASLRVDVSYQAWIERTTVLSALVWGTPWSPSAESRCSAIQSSQYCGRWENRISMFSVHREVTTLRPSVLATPSIRVLILAAMSESTAPSTTMQIGSCHRAIWSSFSVGLV